MKCVGVGVSVLHTSPHTFLIGCEHAVIETYGVRPMYVCHMLLRLLA